MSWLDYFFRDVKFVSLEEAYEKGFFNDIEKFVCKDMSGFIKIITEDPKEMYEFMKAENVTHVDEGFYHFKINNESVFLSNFKFTRKHSKSKKKRKKGKVPTSNRESIDKEHKNIKGQKTHGSWGK